MTQTGAVPAKEHETRTNPPTPTQANEPTSAVPIAASDVNVMEAKERLRDKLGRTVGRIGVTEHALRYATAASLILEFCNREDELTVSPYEFCKQLGLNERVVSDAFDIITEGPNGLWTAVLFGIWLADECRKPTNKGARLMERINAASHALAS